MQKSFKKQGYNIAAKALWFAVLLTLIISTLTGCKKENNGIIKPEKTKPGLTLQKAKDWYFQQNLEADSVFQSLSPDWKNARQPTGKPNTWIVPLPGSPIFQGIRQGTAGLILQTDSSGNILPKIVEVIPDAYTLQLNKKMDKNRFTGRILFYNKNYQLQTGRLIFQGKPVGEIKNKVLPVKQLASMKKAYSAALQENFKIGLNTPYNLSNSNRISLRPTPDLPAGERYPADPNPDSSPNKPNPANTFYDIPAQTSGLQEVCTWYDSFYFDADGVFTIHSERICNYVWVDDEDDWDDYYDLPGTGSPNNPVPQPSNLPAEDQPSVNAQKMMDCFTAISGPYANYQVKIHVQEPLPGTSFNIGPNSFGHVAIELTVTNGGQSVSQVVGFYPTGSGLDKMISPSRIVNNGNIEYDVSATFYVSQYYFKQITNFIAHPPDGYHYLTYNCTAFVYNAATLGGISIPMGYTTVGLSGPGGATVAQTPAGLGSELRSMKANNPYLNITTGGGRARSSKGECN